MITLSDILTPEELYNRCKELYPKISTQMDGDDPDMYVMRANELVAIMATTGKMLADAKYWKDNAIRESVMNVLKEDKKKSLPASVINDLIKTECKGLNYLVNWIEQLDKECKYQVELLRSLISLRKTEMNNQFIPQ